jgi:threonylcarbamoyladenosine tRNA methylthiotransferase MtaB
MNTYRIHFLGCKSNQSDALSYAGILDRAGWRQAGEGEAPALLLVQSCTVTMSADAQARQLVRKLKRENHDAKVLMTGCFAQQPEASASLPEADYVVGNLNPRKWEILSEIAGRPIRELYPDFPMPAGTSRTRPYIKIQEGCDAKCSYCIIPSVRGKSRSLPPEEVLRRIEHFRDSGLKEMIFTGISMGGYGKDLSPKTSLSALMRRVDALPGDFRIRLSSLEPEEIDDEFIEVYTSSSRFQPHLHIPLQSASDRVLKQMRRQYLFRRYDSILKLISGRIPDLNLGTDLLVGFPGEDRDAFDETYRYFSETSFAYAHVFPFSRRPGTPAALFRPVAREGEIAERASVLRAVAQEKSRSYRERFVGRTLRALILNATGEALTDNYIRVQFRDEASRHGVRQVRIDSIAGSHTWGSLQ